MRAATAGESGASPAWAVRIARTSSAGSTSLSRKPAAPARSAANSRSSSPKLVSTITRAAGAASRSRGSAATPSSRGIARSSSTTSGAARHASATAASPSAASPTTSTSSWRSRNVRRPWRTTAWSSAIRTRITPATSSRTRVPSPTADSIVERPAELRRALLHRGQAEPAPAHRARRSTSKPQPVVGHAQHERPAAVLEPHLDVLGAGVAQRVLQRLLRDPEHLRRRLARAAAAGRRASARSSCAETRRSTSTCLRSTLARPSASSDAGRSSNTTARSSSIASRERSRTRVELRRPPRRGRARAACPPTRPRARRRTAAG